jgi:hypothetical protein
MTPRKRKTMKAVNGYALVYRHDDKILGLERWALDLHPTRRRARVANQIVTEKYGDICRIVRVIIKELP